MTEHIDMARFVEAKSDQLNCDDLIGAPRTITVRKVTGEEGDQPISIYYEGDNDKPFKPCKTMRRVLLGVWGRHAQEYIGRSMTLYRDDSVTFGGLNVGGIRISHMSHIDKEAIVVVMKSKGKKAGVKVLPLQVEQQVDPARAKAESWTEKLIAALADTDVDGATALFTKHATTLEKLEREHPDLHARIEQHRPSEEDPFSEDVTSPAEQTVAQFIERAKAATTAKQLAKIVAEAEPHKEAMPDELAVKLEVGFDRERVRIEAATPVGVEA